MIKQTSSASRQFHALLDGYMRSGWDQAINNLVAAYREAAARIERDPTVGVPFPRPYPEIASWGFLWIKSHIYWIGYSIAEGHPVITNVFNDKHDIPGRIAGQDEEVEIGL